MSENTDMVYMEKGEDGVAVVYLNQPKKKNAINATMMDLLTDCFHEADEDPEVRAIVLRGSGNCFTSGGELSQSRGRRFRAYARERFGVRERNGNGDSCVLPNWHRA